MKNRIAEQARTWIDTKFVHHGRLKKNGDFDGGCDCLGLLIGVLRELQIDVDFSDDKNYSRIINDDILINNCEKYLNEKSISNLETGDIAIFQFRKKLPPQHLGIISKMDDKITLIHSYSKVGRIVEHGLDEIWLGYLHSVFELRYIK